MWNSLADPWRACLRLSWESYREGSIPIGAVITDAGGRILAAGRNRAGAPPACEAGQITGGLLAHAEINAILRVDLKAVDIASCELYSAVEPCPLCIGAICMAGIKVVRYAATDAWAGSTNLLQASPYLVRKAIRAVPPEDARLATIIQMIQTDAASRNNHPRWPEVMEAWSRHNAHDVALGRRLHASGELDRLRRQGASVEDVVALVDGLIDEWGPFGTEEVRT